MKKLLFLLTLLLAAAFTHAQTIVFSEDFDLPSGPDKVITTSTGDSLFGINTRLHYSGTQCDTVNPPFNSISYLTTLPFSTLGQTNVLLKFAHICKVEIFDTAKVEVSVDGGTTWVRLNTQYINPGNSDFASQSYRFCSSTYSDFIWQPSVDSAKPKQNWWRNEIFDISVLAANKADVRVRFVVRGNANFDANRGWYLDDILVVAGTSELMPPKITMKAPIIQDTVFNTGPYDIFAYIRDASGIDTAYLVYQLNGGANQGIPMLWVSDSTYKGTIPSYTYNNRIDYHVYAADNSTTHNSANGPNQWFFIKHGPNDVQVGTGTVTTDNYGPFYNLFENNRTQMLYKASEINSSGSITHLAFNLSAISPDLADRHFLNLKINFKTTALTTLGSAYEDMTTSTTVFSSADYNLMQSTGWHTFDITDFTYNGTSNLIVEVVWGDNGGWGTSYNVYRTDYSSGSDILVVYGYADSETPPVYDGNSKIRPNIKFTFPVTNYSQDAGVKQMFTPTGTVMAGTNLPITLNIKNYAVDSLKKVTIKWKLDGVLQTPSYTWNGVLLQDVVSSTINIGNANVTPGPHTIKAWTELPNDSTDQNHANDTASISFYACNEILNGTYTIGPSGANFPTFAAALTALQNCGISGPVVFNVQSGTYNEQISFPEISSASATNTITFQSLTGNNNDVTVQYVTTSANNYIVKLNGADHFRFKNMTLKAKGLDYNHVIEMSGNAINNQFEGNKIIGKDTTLTTTNNALVYSAAGLDSLSVFNNNTFTNGTYGMYFYGVSSTSLENKTTITNNTFTNQYYRGIYLGYHNAPLVSGNTITTNTTSTAFYGIYAYYCDNNLRILKNKIVIPNSGYGIYIYYSDGASGNEGLTANNAISIGGTSTSYGIYDYYSSYQNIYYNSVNVYANYSSAYAMYLSGSSTYTNHKFKNNIFAYTGANTSGIAFYAYYPAQVSGSNYNDLFSTGTNLGNWNGTLRANLAVWKTASTRDTNSVSVNPEFLSATDLHTMISELNAHATPLAIVTDDIQGNPRNATTPDIGAYEFNLPAINIAVVSLVQPAMACSHTANENVVVRIKNAGANPITSVEMYYTMNNGPVVHETCSATIQPDSSYNYTFTQQANMSAVDNYYFDIYAHVTGDTIPQNDTINNIMVASGFNFAYGSYSMGFEASENMSLWSKLDADADTKTWVYPYNSSTYSNTGSYCAQLTDNTTGGTADDWLFSRCLSLEAGKRYKIDYWFRVSSATYPQTLTLKYGTAATPAGMTNLLKTITLATNTVYQKVSVQFIAPATGVYYFGWWASSPVYTSTSYIYMDDINISLMPDYDAALTTITAPVSSCSLTNDEPITVKIKNTGAQIINTTELYYKLNNGTPLHETLNTPISPDSTITYTFTQHIDLSGLGNYTLLVYINVSGDTIQANDTLNSALSNGHNFAYGPYTMGFEPTEDYSGWSVLNTGGGTTYLWKLPYSSSTYSHTGTYSAQFYNGTTNTGEDWLFSRCFHLDAGQTYSISFWYRVYGATYPQTITLKYGTAASIAGMTTTLVSLPNITNATYNDTVKQFVAPATGTYYFGWSGTVGATYYAYIDDINITWIPDQEAALLSIVSPASGCGLSNAEPVTLQIKNTGADTIQGNFTGHYVFNNGSSVSQTIPNTILPGDTIDFTFTQTVDVSVLNTDVIFPIKAWVSLIGDPLHANDTLNKQINSQHVPAAPVTVNDTVTFGTPATLHAIAADSVYWYNVPTGGNSIASGHTFTTPNLFNMGIYYAEARTGGGTAISETFDGTTLPANWTAVNGSEVIVDINLGNDAGGNPNEAIFDCLDASSTNNTTSRLYYGPLNTSGSSSLTLQWDNYLDHYSASYPYSVSVQTSTDHVTWHNTSWVKNPTADISAGIQTVTINTADVGSSTFYLSFTLTGNAFGCMYWYIDNFSLSGGMSGCPSARVPDTAFLELYPKEASVDTMISPVSACSDGIEDVSILVSNNGLDTLVGNVYVNYTINGSPAVSELITLPDSIFPGTTIPYTFATPLTTGLSQANVDSTYNIVVWVELAGDPYPANDTVWNTIDLSYTPPAPVVVNYTIPYATTVTMNAVSSDSISWYDVPTGGTALSDAHSYTTPVLYNTTVYYVEAVSGSIAQHVGPVDNTMGGGSAVAYSYYTTFDVLSASVNIQGVHVYPGASGNVVLYIANSAGTVLNTTTYAVSTPGVKTFIPINFEVPAGTNYRLGYNSTSGGVAMYRNTAGAAFPYTLPGIISITGNNFDPDYFYYNYDWVVGAGGSGCASERLADTVFVTGVPACDVSVQEIYEPNTGIELTTTETVKVKIKNFGTAPAANFPIHYTVNGGTPVDDIVPGPIASNDTAEFTFAVPADLSVVGTTYNIVAYTTMGCDATHINDTAFKTVQNNPLVYCTSTSTSVTAYEDIGNVTLSNINNGIATPVTYNTTAVYGYSDFTVSLPAVQLNAANTYPISVSIISATSFYSTYVKAFIDYNRDGIFDPTTEMVLGALATSSSPTVSGSFTVPVTAITGLPTRLRVVAEETTVAANVEPCGNYTWGETEDYTVMISPQIPHDAGAVAIIQPLAVQTEGDTVPVRVIVKNFGSDTIHNTSNMVVAYSYNGGAPQSITWNGGDILPLATDTAVLPNITVTPNASSICAWTELAGDTYLFNDTVCKSFTATPLYDAGITAFLTPQALLVSGANESVQVIFKNFGADTLTSLDLKYSINGVVMATQPWTGTLLPYMTDTVTFTQTFTVPDLTFDLCAYTSLVTDANHTNDTLCISPNGAITSTLPYYDNFDGVDVYWTPVTEDDTKWELGMPGYGVTNTVHSAPNAWDINLDTSYYNNAEAMLYTQYFNFSAAVNAKMKFWLNFNTETGWDATRIDYTIDSGANWNVLGIQNDPRGTYWYNDDYINSSGLPGWTNNSSGWKYCEYKLDTLNLTSLVRFRFVFTSDGSGLRDGVSVDDFAITLPYPKDAGVQVIKTPTAQGPAGTSVTVKSRIKNFGSDTLHSIPVSYRIGLSGTPVTQTWTGTLAPEDTTTVTFATALIIPTGAFDLYSYTGLVPDGDHFNDTVKNHITGVPKFDVPYSDNFEGLVTWSGTGTSNLWEWGVPTATLIDSAYSPTHAWVTNLDGNYTNSATEYLYSPYFMFTGVDSAYLEFYHWYNTENNYDGGRIEYSVNGGTWTILGAVADPNAVNWYTSTISSFPCWSGNSNGYVYSKYRLTSIPAIVNATTPVQFRYKFFSDVSTVYEGWAIDNFAITAPPIPQDAGVTAILQPSAATMTGSPVTVQVTIKNYGISNLTSVPVRYVVNGGAVTAETWTGTLVPGATTNYTFTAPFNSPGSTYEICAFTKVTGDIYTFNDTTCASFGTTPAPHDLGISAILSPGLTTIFNHADTVKVRIKNYGYGIETSIPLVFLRNSVQVGAGVWTGTLNGGDSVDYTFTTLNVSPLGNYSLCAKTTLVGDANATNDQICIYAYGQVGIETYDYSAFVLMQNTPNPAVNNTSIVFYVPEGDNVRFEMYDVLGKAVRAEDIDAVRGENQIDLDAATLNEGVYFYSVEYKGEKQTKRMVVVK